MSDTFTSLLCIELDCLLDTRLATLFLIDSETAETVLRKGYLDRWTDEFPVNQELFEKVYRSRDRQTLKNSVLTPMVRLCKEFVHETLKQGVQGPYQYTPKIMINMYPYELTDTEQEIIVRAVASAVKQVCDIQIVRYDYDQLNPAWVKRM
jgi:tRNA G37 N-methylase Trm5